MDITRFRFCQVHAREEMEDKAIGSICKWGWKWLTMGSKLDSKRDENHSIDGLWENEEVNESVILKKLKCCGSDGNIIKNSFSDGKWLEVVRYSKLWLWRQ